MVNKKGANKLHSTDCNLNFGTFLGNVEEDEKLSIVDYNSVVGYMDINLGMGVRTEVAWKTGDKLPLLVWGTFITEQKFKEDAILNGTSQEYPTSPGVYALSSPYEETACIVADNCPARYVNDAKGVPEASTNIQFLQHPNPRELYYDARKGLHLFLQAQATRDIKEGEQLFIDYGDLFWNDHQPIARKLIELDVIEEVKAEDDDDAHVTSFLEKALKQVEEEDPSEEIKNPVSGDDDEIYMAPLRTPLTTTLRALNASALSQDTPLSPVPLRFEDKDLDNSGFTNPKQKRSRSNSPVLKSPRKRVTKSGGDKKLS